jgi:hypothetical protein
MDFNASVERHKTSSRFWSYASGFLKKRSVRDFRREIPLLATRLHIVRAVKSIREDCQCSTQKQANLKYGKKIARQMKRQFPEIEKLHKFRNFYVLSCFHYFNEKNASLPHFAAEILGHKSMGTSVITYLSSQVSDIGSLSFR